MSPTDPNPSPLAALINRLVILAAPAILGAMATYIATHQPAGVTVDPTVAKALESVRPMVDPFGVAPAPDDATRIGRLESRVGGLVAELAELRAELTAHIHPGRPVTWPNHPGRLGSASQQSPPPTGSAPIGSTASPDPTPNGPP